ncbi:beta-glucuronosyltransferase GlcAT14A [Panicum miliaceum]|uniref:Beta-glucuronosyltransferase GlcAT14A n=1 Tax=Panicum miliaceum TaxID=4540 RepID=A0A3L6TRD4_PANMI|nr:beta-glucuronosyltransferase GlcAT14A [Panicum miliaceum]
MALRARVMGPGGGRRELLLVSAAFTALLVASILLLPSLLLRTGGAGPGFGPGGDQQPRYPVSFAYLISASSGDAARAARLLAALYHPANTYLLHLDREAPAEEHRRLAELVSARGVYARAGNVWVVGRPNLVTYRGPTMLTTTVHAVAVLLRLRRRWDWFVNLSASDYPLVTQDDMMEAFAGLPRDLNFIQHTSHLGWKIKKRARPVILDTALYEDGRAELIRPVNITTNLRRFPTAFKLYTGSAWTMLSRPFAEYVTMGWDNLPRTLLLYHANIISSPEFYFQTVACNSRRFRNATVNHDLHFIRWDNPPKQHPLHLTSRDYRRMLLSGAPFARKFREGDPVLDRIDRDILRRAGLGQFAYGGWCSESGEAGGGAALCGNPQEPGRKGAVKAGAGSRRLKALLGKALAPGNFRRKQCR